MRKLFKVENYLQKKSTVSKGQLISKANCQAEDSSKKQTNEFVFTSMRRVFVHFLEESSARKKRFEIIWPLIITSAYDMNIPVFCQTFDRGMNLWQFWRGFLLDDLTIHPQSKAVIHCQLYWWYTSKDCKDDRCY